MSRFFLIFLIAGTTFSLLLLAISRVNLYSRFCEECNAVHFQNISSCKENSEIFEHKSKWLCERMKSGEISKFDYIVKRSDLMIYKSIEEK